MDFSLTDEQRAFQVTARQFARDEMMPHARDWDEGEVFPEGGLSRDGHLRPPKFGLLSYMVASGR